MAINPSDNITELPEAGGGIASTIKTESEKQDSVDNSQTGKNTLKISSLEGEISGMKAQINMLMGQVI